MLRTVNAFQTIIRKDDEKKRSYGKYQCKKKACPEACDSRLLSGSPGEFEKIK